MILGEWDDIGAATLVRLCAEGCPESDSLDFKRNHAGRPEEVLKDVCAMANSGGGDLIYGIDEKDGCASALAPLTGESPDDVIRRIAQIVDGIEPRIHGLRYKHVPVDGGYAVVVRVPNSFNGPHCFRVNNARRFVLRNGPGTSDMTFDQLRTAFDRTATLADRSAVHIATRLQAIGNDRAFLRLEPGPLCVIQLVPIAAIAGRTGIDVLALHGTGYARFMGPGWSGASSRLTLDGLLVFPGDGRRATYGYSMVYRSGVLEAVRKYGEERQFGGNAPIERFMPRRDVALFFAKSANTFADQTKQVGITGPALLSMAVLRAEGFQLGVHNPLYDGVVPVADRPDVILPDIWIEQVEALSADQIVRSALDVMWQAFGLERCEVFDGVAHGAR